MTSKNSQSARILVVDDREDTLRALRILLSSNSLESETAASPAEAISMMKSRCFDIVLMDMNFSRDTTSGKEGLDLLSQIRGRDGLVSIVVMTAWSSVNLAVEAMQSGANDFLEKPWENERLLSILRTQIQLVGARQKQRLLNEENRILRADSATTGFIAESAAMRPLLELIKRTSPSDEPILITGENGVGKGLIARLIHEASARSSHSMITVNAGGLPQNVFESELFGHVAGSFTGATTERIGRFELADSGTLFLDEVANLPHAQQTALLHVVETGEYEPVGSSRRRQTDVRLISATNADLGREVSEGRFRQDLYYRLNAIQLHVPPLRDRLDDIMPLATHFLKRHATRYRRPAEQLTEASRQALLDYPWPGNIRELDHTMARAVLMANGATVEVEDLGLRQADGSTFLEKMTLEEVEKVMIQKALVRCQGNVHRAAGELGLSRSALYRRLQRFGLQDAADSERSEEPLDL